MALRARGLSCAESKQKFSEGPHASIGINAGKTIKQGAIAAVIGAVVTPFAAILAFVDPGLAKDENCAALLSEVKPHAIKAPADRSTKK